MQASVEVYNLRKTYGNQVVFDSLNLSIEKGRITVLFGPNGSGKSTLLSILAGLIPYNSGTYVFENKAALSYIFQNYKDSLFPWRTNFENVAYPLEVKGWKKKDIKEKIDSLVKALGLHFEWNRYPYELSGGQQQLLAFMRAIITDPEVLFIDEPFGALDYENNLLLRDQLQKYYLKFRPTIVLITHNIEEAVHLAQKIIILSKKPTQIVGMIENSLPYPREINFLKTETFNQVKDKVLTAFQKAVHI